MTDRLKTGNVKELQILDDSDVKKLVVKVASSN